MSIPKPFVEFFICYAWIFIIIGLFKTNINIYICKLSTFVLLLWPFYLGNRYPNNFGNKGIWLFFWGWYFCRFYDMCVHYEYFKNKSCLFCYFHGFTMDNMLHCKNIKPYLDIKSLLLCGLNLLFIIIIIPSISDMNRMANICDNSNIMVIFQFCCFGFNIMNILYSVSNGMNFITQLCGYKTLQKPMNKPWLSQSIHDFWSKRWDIYVQDMLKRYIYIPLRNLGLNPKISIFITFLLSGIIHGFALYLEKISFNVLLICLTFFVFQPILLNIESNVFNSKQIISNNIKISRIIWTFCSLIVSFVICFNLSCLIII